MLLGGVRGEAACVEAVETEFLLQIDEGFTLEEGAGGKYEDSFAGSIL